MKPCSSPPHSKIVVIASSAALILHLWPFTNSAKTSAMVSADSDPRPISRRGATTWSCFSTGMFMVAQTSIQSLFFVITPGASSL
eukprot:CAMPEP_0194753498 /NCGR_PEP_ID=MMETSP0323_2-20130528/7435_1 /TAXON_ID=2866 ORGANISM="Crypthecodinium cohnii, Strain Seligo" /NCGR_SAMPLE_ID=MMETSP0323_2 /ASSEMBLY_ACC=CAM_ASM_000346 /LENGTH=84 /DNA_ID=CAMNT_0039671373 /DNA_START=366 /DNA_END=620 /DNA_ORIENTATION=-